MKLRRALAFSLAFCLLITGCQGKSRSTLKEEFVDNGRNLPYSQNIPLSEMDFAWYRLYLPVGTTAYHYGFVRKLALPCDIEYYRSKEDSSPTHTLTKGTEIYILPADDNWQTIGYGMICWPDYEEGWRYGYPFTTTDFSSLDSLPKTQPTYYVKTEQLLAVAEAFYKANNEIFSSAIDAYSIAVVLFIDIQLYKKGVFCSPDLEKHYSCPDDLP